MILYDAPSTDTGGLQSRDLAVSLQSAVGTALSDRANPAGSATGRVLRKPKGAQLRGRFSIVQRGLRFHVLWNPSIAKKLALDISEMSPEEAVQAICAVS